MDVFRMRQPCVVQPPYFFFVNFEEALFCKAFYDGRSTSCLVHQLLTGYLFELPGGIVRRGSLIKSCQMQIAHKRFMLPIRTRKHIQRYVKGLLRAVRGRKFQISFSLYAVSCIGLKACWQCGIEHFADGRHVVRGYPLPQSQLMR